MAIYGNLINFTKLHCLHLTISILSHVGVGGGRGWGVGRWGNSRLKSISVSVGVEIGTELGNISKVQFFYGVY